MKSIEREIRKLTLNMQIPNVEIQKGGNNHYKIRSNGKLICTTSSTRGNVFVKKYLEQDLKRYIREINK